MAVFANNVKKTLNHLDSQIQDNPSSPNREYWMRRLKHTTWEHEG